MAGEMQKTIQELESNLKKALAEIQELRRENTELRNQLLSINSNQVLQTNPKETIVSVKALPAKLDSLDNNSSPVDKIALFKSLFKGREDVFALRWTGKDGKGGYSPACSNQWNRELCKKYEKQSCFKCSNRKLSPLSDEIISEHLKGRIIVGIYPLLEDESCWFLAIDFDKKDWMTDVTEFRNTCNELNVSCYVEKSRSGNGAHCWFFFDKPIPARAARKFGSVLLTKTMERRHQIGLESYDRLFPNQDTMPSGGFGNLIALPLQKEARSRESSVFVDEEFKTVPDQWSFLSGIHKMSLYQIERIISDLSQNSPVLGELIKSEEESDYDIDFSVNKSDIIDNLPEEIIVILSNMLYIIKSGLPNKLINKIMRMAAFLNPEFYRAQAMRMPTYNKPRVITLSETNEKYIMLPRGCLDSLYCLAELYNIKITLLDRTNQGITQNFSFKGKLTYIQNLAAQEILKHDFGILSAATAFGKTVVAISLIAHKNTNTLIIVHRKQLLEQWKERLVAFLNISAESIGEIGGGKSKRTNIVDIAIIQSLNSNGKIKEFIRDYGLVIVDECHHISAFSFEQVMKKVQAKYVYGLTATPIRKDGHHPIITMQCGKIRYKVDAKMLNKYSIVTHKVIIRNTEFVIPEANNEKLAIQTVYQMLSEDEKRNDMIFDDLLWALEEKRSPMVITERTAHLEYLEKRLKGFARNILVFKGKMGKKQLQSILTKLHSIPDNEERVILATGKYIGEGFDDARLDTLFLTMPISWKGTLQQYAGRLHRTHHDKTDIRIFDYVDQKVPVLMNMFKKRLKGYHGMGYEEL